MTVWSEEGLGSTFTLRIPLYAAAATGSAGTGSAGTGSVTAPAGTADPPSVDAVKGRS